MTPRRLVHRGSVLASGFVLDTRLVPELTARIRILQIERRVAGVYRVGDLLIVHLRGAVRIDAATAIGAPLTAYGRLHSSAPLDADEVRALDTGVEAAVVVEGGTASVVALDAGAREDIAQWLDVSFFAVDAETTSLGEEVASSVAQWSPVSDDVRAPLGVGALSGEARALLETIAPKAKGGALAREGRSARSGTLGWRGQVLSFLERSLAWLSWRAPRRSGTSSSLVARPRPVQSAGASWLAKVFARFEDAAARLLAWSRLASFVGRRHAQYIQRLFEMFEADDLEGALRHAIPLNDGVRSALKTRPALATPSPRNELVISSERVLASTSLAVGENLFETLERTYRRACEELERRGDIEKAAFVLAELLHRDEEAVSLLERHRRWTLAAEIAEARNLAPGIVVRQWFLAGNKERAIRVARRTGAFADAVSRLERSHAPEGKALRLEWADVLASSGAYAAAVDAIWPVEDGRGLALAWVERAIEVGGITGAKMLVRKLHLVPEAFVDVRDRVASLFADEDDGRLLAHAVGAEVLAGSRRDDARMLAKMAARTLFPPPREAHVDGFLQRLIEVATDPVFAADVKQRRSPPARANGDVWVRASARTERGAPQCNDDACIAVQLSDAEAERRDDASLEFNVPKRGVLLAAIDGMGGTVIKSGVLATEILTRDLRASFREGASDVDEGVRHLVAALEHADRELRTRSKEPGARGCGCALTAAIVRGRTLVVAHVGDTRGYVFREGKLVPITKEHSLLNDCIAMGQVRTSEEREAFPYKNVIVRALGIMNHELKPDVVCIDLCRRDTLLLCSDGLWGAVDDGMIRDALIGRSRHVACDELVRAALDAGAPDNIAVVVAHFNGSGLPLPDGEPVVATPSILEPADAAEGGLSRASNVPLRARRAGADTGTFTIYDAAELPDGRMLVALGEIGVWLLSREGNVLTRFVERAHSITISDHGDRAILQTNGSPVRHLARLDIGARKIRPWCDVRIDLGIGTFDGETWYTARDGHVFAIDALSTGWEHVWDVRTGGQAVLSIKRNETQVSVWVEHRDEAGEIWTFEGPSRTLRHRRVVPGMDDAVLHFSINAMGRVAAWKRMNVEDGLARIYDGSKWHDLPLVAKCPTSGYIHAPQMGDDWVAFTRAVEAGEVIHIYDMRSQQERAVIELDGASSCSVRFQGDRAICFDTCGRIIVVSLSSRRILREFRIS